MKFALAEKPGHGGRVAICLRLRLTHSAGEKRRGAVTISRAGAGLADALQLCGERQSEAQWQVANRCRIAWLPEAGEWLLFNGSPALMCVRNGERVHVGGQASIAEGDTLELGLLRFEVEECESHEGAAPETPWQAHDGDEDGDKDGEKDGNEDKNNDATAAFDLRELDRPRGLLADSPGDPFSVLDIEGAQPQPVADVLAGLLARPASPRAHPVQQVVPKPAPGSFTGLFDELHDAFVRAVRDPSRLAGRNDWEGLVAATDEPAPSLDDLSVRAGRYPLLRDILQPREFIDRTIDGFEALMDSGLLDVDRPDEVLALFAPELTRGAAAVLPELTRREHHAVSPDSHVRIGFATPGDGGPRGGST